METETQEMMTARYLLKLRPSQKAELERRAAAAGISVGEYLRSVLKIDERAVSQNIQPA